MTDTPHRGWTLTLGDEREEAELEEWAAQALVDAG